MVKLDRSLRPVRFDYNFTTTQCIITKFVTYFKSFLVILRIYVLKNI